MAERKGEEQDSLLMEWLSLGFFVCFALLLGQKKLVSEGRQKRRASELEGSEDAKEESSE